ncbi:MAG: hypothetical protein AB1489_36570 [Acidobacteriota bacterium]
MAGFNPRIHVLLARDGQLGVVIRRGPSKHVCTMLWDRHRDEFQIGQWMKGRIYERRSDLSPNGKYLIYFAMNGKWDSQAKGSWTAISRVPYLKALAIFPKGDCWHGGGLFTSNRTYWLNDGYGHSLLRDSTEVQRDLKFQQTGYFGGECLSVYYPRLLRDGWNLTERVKVAAWQHYDIFDKPVNKEWVLRKIAHAEIGAAAGKGCYWDEHELLHTKTGTSIKYPDWEWAEIDKKRLVWANGGKLFTSKVAKDGLTNEIQLFDFSEMAFEPIQAPY